MITGADKARLSKRHGATSVTAFRVAAILPLAMLNYLALLGWSAGDDREVFTREELVSLFTFDRVSRNPAVFDVQKLQWMNREHFGRLSFGDKVRVLVPAMRAQSLWPPGFRVDLGSAPHLRVVTGSAEEKVAAAIQPLGEDEWLHDEPAPLDELPRLRLILEALGNRFGGPHDAALLRCFYTDDFPYDPQAVAKCLHGEPVPARLRALADALVEKRRPNSPRANRSIKEGVDKYEGR